MFDKVKRALHRRSVGWDSYNSEKPSRAGLDEEPHSNTRTRPSRYSEDDHIHKQRALRHKPSVEDLPHVKSPSRPGSIRSFHAFGDDPSRHPAIYPLDTKPLPRSARTSTESLSSHFRAHARDSSVSSMGPTLPTRALGESAIPTRTTSKRKTGGYQPSTPASLPQQHGAHKRYVGAPQPYRHLDEGRGFRSEELPAEREEEGTSTRYREHSAYAEKPLTQANPKPSQRHVTDRNQGAPTNEDYRKPTIRHVIDRKPVASAPVTQPAPDMSTGIYETVPLTTTRSGGTYAASMTIDHTTHNNPAVTHHNIRPHTHTIIEPKRTRSYHFHEHRTVIRPIIDPEPRILPAEHYVQDWRTGKTFWIPSSLGRELDELGGPRREVIVKDGDLIGAMERVRLRD